MAACRWGHRSALEPETTGRSDSTCKWSHPVSGQPTCSGPGSQEQGWVRGPCWQEGTFVQAQGARVWTDRCTVPAPPRASSGLSRYQAGDTSPATAAQQSLLASSLLSSSLPLPLCQPFLPLSSVASVLAQPLWADSLGTVCRARPGCTRGCGPITQIGTAAAPQAECCGCPLAWGEEEPGTRRKKADKEEPVGQEAGRRAWPSPREPITLARVNAH